METKLNLIATMVFSVMALNGCAVNNISETEEMTSVVEELNGVNPINDRQSNTRTSFSELKACSDPWQFDGDGSIETTCNKFCGALVGVCNYTYGFSACYTECELTLKDAETVEGGDCPPCEEEHREWLQCVSDTRQEDGVCSHLQTACQVEVCKGVYAKAYTECTKKMGC